MTTKELIHAEIDTLSNEEMLNELYTVIRQFVQSKRATEQSRSKLQQIQIKAPADFLVNFEKYTSGEKSTNPIPTVTEKQRQAMSRALHELGDDDLEWTNDIIADRKNKQYPHHFFDE